MGEKRHQMGLWRQRKAKTTIFSEPDPKGTRGGKTIAEDRPSSQNGPLVTADFV